MRFDVTYGLFRELCVFVFQPCDVVQFVSSAEPYVCTAFSPSPSLPSLTVDWVSIGLVSIPTDLVSVIVSGGWLLRSELPWIPAHALLRQGSFLGSFLALVPPRTLTGTIPKLIYW